MGGSSISGLGAATDGHAMGAVGATASATGVVDVTVVSEIEGWTVM